MTIHVVGRERQGQAGSPIGDDAFAEFQRWWFSQRELRSDRLIHAVIERARSEVVIAAPFLQQSELAGLLEHVPSDVRVTVVTNWSERALRDGVTDPAVFEVVAERPNTVLAHNRWLHAKFYRGDDVAVVGSANVTRAGLGALARYANLESVVPVRANVEYIQQLEAAIMFAEPIDRRRYEAARMLTKKEQPRAGTALEAATGQQPWPHQVDALGAIERARRLGRDRALVVMAPGTGKTFTAALDAARVAATGRVLFIAHRREILEQAAETFAVALDDPEIGWFAGRKSASNLDTAQVVFATWGRFDAYRRKFGREPFAPEDFDYVVIDEAHHAPAPSYKRTVDGLSPKFLLALTATPERLDDHRANDVVVRKVEALFGRPVHDLPLEVALARGLLAPVDYRLIADDLDAQLLELAVEERWSVERLNRNLFVPRHDHEVAAIIERHRRELADPRALVFCSSIAHAEAMAARIDGAASLHSALPKTARDDIVARFRSGELRTVVTVDLFNEGIDVPGVDLVVFLRSTASRAVWIQQLGRGLRKADHKDGVRVLDFVGSIERLQRVREFHDRIGMIARQRTAGRSGKTSLHVDLHRIEFREDVLDVLDAVARINSVRAPIETVDEARAGLYQWARQHLEIDGAPVSETDLAEWSPTALHLDAAYRAGYSWPSRRWIRETGDRGINGVRAALGLDERPSRVAFHSIQEAADGLYEWAGENVTIEGQPFQDPQDRGRWIPSAREISQASRAHKTWSLPKWFAETGSHGLASVHRALGLKPRRIERMEDAIEGLYEWARNHVVIDGTAFTDANRAEWYPSARQLAKASADHATWSPTTWFARTGSQGLAGVYEALGLPEIDVRPGQRICGAPSGVGRPTAGSDALMQRMRDAQRAGPGRVSSRGPRSSPGVSR